MNEGRESQIHKAIDAAGGAKAVADGIEAYNRNMSELDSRTDELRKRFPHHWVALQDGKVLTHTGTLEELMALLDQEGWSRDSSAVRYMDPNPVKLIL